MDIWNEDLEEDYRRLNYLLDSPQVFTREQIKEELGINILPNQLPTFKLFVLNFYTNTREAIAFTYGNNPHPIERYNPHKITYSTLQGVINKLYEAKLIKFVKGKASKKKEDRKESTAEPTAKFWKWLNSNVWIEDVFTNIDTHIRVRDKSKIYDYEDTKYTNHVNKVMKRYHKKLNEWGVAIDGIKLEDIHIFVNFQAVKGQRDKKGNLLIRHGGRFASAWNSVPSKERLKRLSFLNVRGELMNIDYTACGTNALYMWETGKFLEHDPYTQFPYYLYKDTVGVDKSEKELRQFIKRVATIGINEDIKSINQTYDKHYKHFHDAERCLDYYKLDNKPVAHWFGKGGVIGRRAMFLESNMVLGVLDKLTRANIPNLNIYDNFIFPKKHKKQVEEIMFEERNLEWLRRLLAKDEQGQLVQP